MTTNTEGIAEGYLSECEDRVRTLEWQLSEATKANERLREHQREAAEALVGEATLHGRIKELEASNERLRSLLARLYTWDMMDSADGPYWRREIDAALGRDNADNVYQT